MNPAPSEKFMILNIWKVLHEYKEGAGVKRVILVIIFASFILFDLSVWPQGKDYITQGEFAQLIGERLGYKEEAIVKLKETGVTPLGEWDPEKPLTIEDIDAILIRMVRRDPIVENIEPAKLLDSIGFPPRDASREWIKTLLESDLFKRTMINLKLLLSGPLLPLPLKHLKLIEIGKGVLTSDIALAEVEVGVEVEVEVEPPYDPRPKSWDP